MQRTLHVILAVAAMAFVLAVAKIVDLSVTLLAAHP